ncbi:MAG: peptidylprolyl isomerase [Kiritimatiellae bacterium]|nr:peptidylprolyl isomerase [Kiritimatiellia bacterium]
MTKAPQVVIETSMGTIKAELWSDKAPKTVENFLKYAEDKFFDNTIFHRVISNFMIQGGGHTADMRKKSPRVPVKNEARSDCPNLRGTLAMARTGVIDSATAQFFINLKDNGFLNHKDKSRRGFGYCVFGKVLSGMDIVDKIGVVETRPGDVPVKTVTIKSIRLVK